MPNEIHHQKQHPKRQIDARETERELMSVFFVRLMPLPYAAKPIKQKPLMYVYLSVRKRKTESHSHANISSVAAFAVDHRRTDASKNKKKQEAWV
jgi:hypothetical protein